MRVGERVKEVLAAADEMARPFASNELLDYLVNIGHSNTSKYCTRAVNQGLLTVDKSGFPRLYTIVPGWREMIERKERKRIAEAKRDALIPAPPFEPASTGEKWGEGWAPKGWSRGEILSVDKPTGRMRGCLEIAQDTAGFPLVPRPPGTKVAIEYGAHEEQQVSLWLQWWRGEKK